MLVSPYTSVMVEYFKEARGSKSLDVFAQKIAEQVDRRFTAQDLAQIEAGEQVPAMDEGLAAADISGRPTSVLLHDPGWAELERRMQRALTILAQMILDIQAEHAAERALKQLTKLVNDFQAGRGGLLESAPEAGTEDATRKGA